MTLYFLCLYVLYVVQNAFCIKYPSSKGCLTSAGRPAGCLYHHHRQSWHHRSAS